jgi:hypothetical protein
VLFSAFQCRTMRAIGGVGRRRHTTAHGGGRCGGQYRRRRRSKG